MDVMMPGMGGFEACKIIKSDHLFSNVPILFVTGLTDVDSERHGFEAGGVDYITKPISAPIVLARVSTHLKIHNQQCLCEKLIKEQTQQLEDSQKSAVFMLGEAAHYNDFDTGEHIWKMSACSAAIARNIGWNIKDIELLEMAAALHDTGKIGIPDSILKKPGKLTNEVWEIMKTHSTIGYNILKKTDSKLFLMAAEIAHYHHEKWNGSGYPKGLKKKEIPESARIVAIADVFDAITMKRSYKKAYPVDFAFNEIKKDRGTHFDPELVDVFFKIEKEIRKINESWNKK
jgi:putative two-component system response regulator